MGVDGDIDIDMGEKQKQKPKVQFSQELFDEICIRIANGGEKSTVTEICREEGMPTRHTFMCWVERTPELREQYDRARLDQEETYFDEILYISDNEPDLDRAKVKIDARKWVRARQNRAKFGDRVDSEITGAGGGPLVVQVVRFGDQDADDSNPK